MPSIANHGTHVLQTLLVGFGQVSAGNRNNTKMVRHFDYFSHAQVLKDHPHFNLAAVVDPDASAREDATQNWGIPIAEDTVHKLPKDFIPDVVVLATPPTPRQGVLETLPDFSGLIVEKPLGETFKKSQEFASFCERLNIPVTVNLMRRAVMANQNLANGGLQNMLGNIQTVSIYYGGGLRNIGLHMIDLMEMFGLEITSAKCLNRPIAPADISSDCNLHVLFETTNAGRISLIPIDFNHFRDVVVDIWGTRGRLEIFQMGLKMQLSPVSEHRSFDGANEISLDRVIELPTDHGKAYYQVYTDLYNAIMNNTETCCPIRVALKSEAVVEAAFISARENFRTVSVEEVYASE